MKLTAAQVKAALPSEKFYRLADGHGLYIEVRPNASKYWRFKYRVQGKERTFSIGVYPAVSLAQARESHDAARRLVRDGIDPTKARKSARATPAIDETNTVRFIADEWFESRKPSWQPSHYTKLYRRLELYIYPKLGQRDITSITPKELHQLLRPMEATKNETAHRTLSICNQVFAYAMRTGRAATNPAASLKDALAPSQGNHYPAILEPKRLGQLLDAIDGYTGTLYTRAALRLLPMLFVRPGDLRGARWTEFDLDRALWTIPAERLKVKTRGPLDVPLATQAVAIFRELELLGRSDLVFPGVRNAKRPMSDNTLNAALRNLGFTADEIVAHGFRSTASTYLNEHSRFSEDAIERQLAHTSRNKIRGIYNRAEYKQERVEMMQFWADYLDSLRSK